MVSRADGVEQAAPLFTDSRIGSFSLITESGVNKLIMRSDKPDACKFQDWIAREVLPAIRRTGGYLLNEAARETAHADTREAPPLPKNGQLGPTLGERTLD